MPHTRLRRRCACSSSGGLATDTVSGTMGRGAGDWCSLALAPSPAPVPSLPWRACVGTAQHVQPCRWSSSGAPVRPRQGAGAPAPTLAPPPASCAPAHRSCPCPPRQVGLNERRDDLQQQRRRAGRRVSLGAARPGARRPARRMRPWGPGRAWGRIMLSRHSCRGGQWKTVALKLDGHAGCAALALDVPNTRTSPILPPPAGKVCDQRPDVHVQRLQHHQQRGAPVPHPVVEPRG